MAAPPTASTIDDDRPDEPELRTLLICPESRLAAEFTNHLRYHSGMSIAHRCAELPTSGEIARVARVHAPRLIVLSFEDAEAAEGLVPVLRNCMPGVPIAGLAATCEPDLLLTVMRMGVQEFLSSPFRADYVACSLGRLREQIKQSPELVMGTEAIYSFLPAKQGAGATTIALNTAVAAAALGDKRVFIGDFDLNAGIIRFVLKLDPSSSVVNAALALDNAHDAVWPNFVSQAAGVDVLHSGRLQPDLRVEPWQLRRLLELVRRSYDLVCVDLSGNFEAYSLEVMRQSRKVFVVTTPELPSLYLAREKIQFLRQLYMGDRLGVILNRTLKKGLSIADVSAIVDMPVTVAFPNDYAAVSRAIENAGPVKAGSELGKHYADFARTIVSPAPAQARRPVRRFLEFFNVANADSAV